MPGTAHTQREMKKMLKDAKKSKKSSKKSKKGKGDDDDDESVTDEADDARADPRGVAPWVAERSCLLLLLKARMLLREMIEVRVKEDRIAAGELSIGEIQKLLEGQEEENELDFISEIQQLKAQMVTDIRRNHTLESDLKKLDKRIALLIKNRGNLQMVLAAQQGHLPCARVLLQACAAPDLANEAGVTPLQAAFDEGCAPPRGPKRRLSRRLWLEPPQRRPMPRTDAWRMAPLPHGRSHR